MWTLSIVLNIDMSIEWRKDYFTDASEIAVAASSKPSSVAFFFYLA